MRNGKDETTKEIAAIAKVAEALKDLGDDAILRVLRWAADHFGAAGVIGDDQRTGDVSEVGGSGGGSPGQHSFERLDQLFTAANPQNANEKVLVAGYWFQEVQGDDQLEAATINRELKHLGHRVANITVTMDRLKAAKPALVVQTKKTGSTKQARKRYRLTTEGTRFVENMLTSKDDLG